MQYVATFTKAIHLDIEIKIEKDCGYCTHDSIKSIDGYFSIDVVFTPIWNANYSVHSLKIKMRHKKYFLLKYGSMEVLLPKRHLWGFSKSNWSIYSFFTCGERRSIAWIRK